MSDQAAPSEASQPLQFSRRTFLSTSAKAAGVLSLGVFGGNYLLPATPAQAATLMNGRWCNPAMGQLTSGYGETAGRPAPHAGWDIANPTGTAVYAAAAGTVVRRGWDVVPGRTGNGIVIDHGSNVYTYYGHLNQFRIDNGASVAAGQRIGDMGETGNTTGPHLHWEVQTGSIGSDIDPRAHLNARGSEIGGGRFPALDPESTGERALAVQYLLSQHDYDIVDFDGYMGPVTTEVVKEWQADNGLVADGQVGPISWGELHIVLELGVADGDHVRALQTALNKRGTDLLVDGNFGSVTDEALQAWQLNNGLAGDGEAGPITWRYLTS